MRVLALNGSPRMDKGNTGKILNPFLDGLKESGAIVDKYNLRKMAINNCTACMKCRINSDVRCVIDDGVNEILKMFLDADILVIATPIYDFSHTSYMARVLERLFYPIIKSEIKIIEDKACFISKFEAKRCKLILLANGTFDGDYTFRSIIDMFTNTSDMIINGQGEKYFDFLSPITVGFAGLFRDSSILKMSASLFENLKKAGVAIGSGGEMSKALIESLNKPVYKYADMTKQQAVEKNVEIIMEGFKIHAI